MFTHGKRAGNFESCHPAMYNVFVGENQILVDKYAVSIAEKGQIEVIIGYDKLPSLGYSIATTISKPPGC